MAKPRVQPGVLTAAAKRVPLLKVKPLAAKVLGTRQEWQSESWVAWRTTPELKQGYLFLGNGMSKLRVFIAVANPANPDGEPIAATSDVAIEAGIDQTLAAAAEAELARLANTPGGMPELQRRVNLNLEIPGEGFLVGYGARLAGEPDPRPGRDWGRPLEADLPEEWSMRSTSELLVAAGKTASGPTDTNPTGASSYAIRSGTGDDKGRPLDPDHDTLVRIWQPDPEWGDLADSAMQGVLGEVRLLHALTNQQMAVANSQMHAGILTVPSELGLGPAAPVDGASPATTPFLDNLDASYETPISDPESLGTVRPLVVFGPKEFIGPDAIRHITMGRTLDETLDARIEARVLRIARGINLPVESTQGHMATTFSNAEQIDQDLFDDHLEPRCRQYVDALTAGVVHPNLTDPERPEGPYTAEQVEPFFAWYDASALVRQADTEANAEKAVKMNLISDAAGRHALGFAEDDAPDALELIIRAGLGRGILTAELTAALLTPLADEAGVELPDPQALAPGAPPAQQALLQALWLRDQLAAVARGDLPAPPPVRRVEGGTPVPFALPAPAALTAATPPDPNPGAELLAIDRDLRARLEVACNDAVERALERASNRLRSRVPSAERSGLSGVGWRDLPAHLGRARVDALLADAGTEALLDPGVWGQLEDQFKTWGAQAQVEATDVAYRVVGGFSAAERTALGLRQVDDLDGAWRWLDGTLRSLAGGALFDPNLDAPGIGEFDPTARVPTGLVREAMARAGGAAQLSAVEGGGVYVTVTDGGSRPVGGIATGDRLRTTMADHGAMVEAYKWVYGPAQRRTNFPPHLRLEGQLFRNFDDPVLLNATGWPALSYYLPGDHKGCRCDVEPVIVPPSALGPAEAATTAGPPAELPDVYPGNLTPAKAEQWLLDNWGQRTATARRHFPIAGLGRASANEVAETLDDLFRRYPATAGRVSAVGAAGPVTTLVNQAGGYRLPRMHPRAYADAAKRVGTIRLSGKFKQAEVEAKSLAANVATGFLQPGGGTLAATVRHEFGHHVFYEAQHAVGGLTSEAGALLARNLEDAIARAAGFADRNAAGYDAVVRHRTIKAQISKYAATNNDELMAEAFSYVTSHPNPSPLARELYDLLVAAAERTA